MKLCILIFTLALTVSVNAQTDLTDIGKIGIQNSNPVAIIDVDGLSGTNGAVRVLRLRAADPAYGEYGFSYFASPGTNGATRPDRQMCLGFNIGGPGYISTDSTFNQCWEDYYATSQGITQSEFYFTAGAPNAPTSRPFAIDLYHNTGTTQVSINSPSFIVSNPTQSNIWLRFLSTDTTGDMVFLNNSGIQFQGNREWAIKTNGAGVLGGGGANWNLFSGGITGETLNLFKNSSTGNGTAPLTIKLGSPVAGGGSLRIGGSSTSPLRWQISGNYSGFSDIQTAFDVDLASTANKIVKRGSAGEINVSSVYVGSVKVIGASCTAIPDSTGTEADNQRAINAMLSCLRTHGALLQ